MQLTGNQIEEKVKATLLLEQRCKNNEKTKEKKHFSVNIKVI